MQTNLQTISKAIDECLGDLLPEVPWPTPVLVKLTDVTQASPDLDWPAEFEIERNIAP